MPIKKRISVSLPVERREPEKYHSIQEAAEYMRCSPNTIAAWLSQGKLRRTKAGTRTLIARSDIEAFLRREE